MASMTAATTSHVRGPGMGFKIMPRDAALTRQQIITAADELFYGQGLHAVSMSAVAARAGVTKKTLYYHFRSKDDLFTAYLEARDKPTLDHFRHWSGDSGTVQARLERIFTRLGRFAGQTKWKGCGFVRAVGELAGSPGHPAVEIARKHKLKLETWMAEALAAEGYLESEVLARALIVLIDGVVTQTLLHRNPLYADAAMRAANALLALRH